jgi:hypothetical protein
MGSFPTNWRVNESDRNNNYQEEQNFPKKQIKLNQINTTMVSKKMGVVPPARWKENQ